jgi:hypothetical protein
MRGRERIGLSNLEKARCGLFTALKVMKRAGNCCLIEERLRNHAWERLAKGEPMLGFPKPAQPVELRVALASTIKRHEEKNANRSRQHAERIARQWISLHFHLIDCERMLNPPRLVVISRLADDRLWAAVLNRCGFDVLAKPFERDEVTRALGYALYPSRLLPARKTAASGRTGTSDDKSMAVNGGYVE